MRQDLVVLYFTVAEQIGDKHYVAVVHEDAV
jgi:hypothetical protein